jgi:hypothetical protein
MQAGRLRYERNIRKPLAVMECGGYDTAFLPRHSCRGNLKRGHVRAPQDAFARSHASKNLSSICTNHDFQRIRSGMRG